MMSCSSCSLIEVQMVRGVVVFVRMNSVYRNWVTSK